MRTLRYKPLLSIKAQYELKSLGVQNEDIYVQPNAYSETLLQGFQLRARTQKNETTVYFAGHESPEINPTDCYPYVQIPNQEYLYFNVQLGNKNLVKGLQFFPSDTDAQKVGFPIVYDGQVNAGNVTSLSARADVKVQSSVIFSWSIPQSETGLISTTAPVTVEMENNPDLKPEVDAALLQIESTIALPIVPVYVIKVDASQWPVGIYVFKIGNVEKKLMIISGVQSQTIGIVRIVKNAFLVYNTPINNTVIPNFQLFIPKRE